MGAGKNIEQTNAIAVFAVFMFFLIVSFGLEMFFHKLQHYFEHSGQHGLLTALNKVKDELMLMGFCSLILIVFEPEIMMICTDMRTIRAVPAQIWNKCPCANLYMHNKYPYLMDVDVNYFASNAYDEKLNDARFGDLNGKIVHANGGMQPDGSNYTFMAEKCTKLQLVLDLLVRQVYANYGCLGSTVEEIAMAGGKGCITDESLIKNMIHSLDFDKVEDVEPDFWFHHPSIVSSMLKFCLWQNSVSLTLFLYFGIKYEQFDQMHTCYWESRTIIGTLPDVFIILFTLIISGMRVLPVYSLVSLTTEHFHERGILQDLIHDWSHHSHSKASKMKIKKRAEDFAHEKAHEAEARRHKNTAVVPVDGSSSIESKGVDKNEDEDGAKSGESEGSLDSSWGRG
eukprot:g4030.t1